MICENIFWSFTKVEFTLLFEYKTGEIISRVIHDVEQTKDFVITGLMNVWLDTATIAIAIIVMFSMNIKLTFVALLILPIYVVAVKYFSGVFEN